MKIQQPTPMSPYGKVIMEATGCAPERTHAIEEVMRDVHPTLDHLTRRQLVALAKKAEAALKIIEEQG